MAFIRFKANRWTAPVNSQAVPDAAEHSVEAKDLKYRRGRRNSSSGRQPRPTPCVAKVPPVIQNKHFHQIQPHMLFRYHVSGALEDACKALGGWRLLNFLCSLPGNDTIGIYWHSHSE